MPATWWVIRPFAFGVRTPDAFAWWDHDGATGPDPGVLVAAAEAGNASMLGLALFNDLQAPVCARHPEVAEIHRGVQVPARWVSSWGQRPTGERRWPGIWPTPTNWRRPCRDPS